MRARLAGLTASLAVLLAGCAGVSHRDAAPTLGSLATSGAGHRFYEIYEPGGPARGTMLMFHGGGWMDARGDARQGLAGTALTLRNAGWRVVNVSYTPGNVPGGKGDPLAMLRDVVAFYDQIRQAFGGPICAFGQSAGGHLAAMLAIERPSLTCAILAAAPLDLATMLREAGPVGAAATRDTFGIRRAVLDEWSPVRLWRRTVDHTAIFLTAAANDTVVPPTQLRAFASVDPGADAQILPGAAVGADDAVPFMHSDVTRASAARSLAALYAWLDRLVPPAARSGSRSGAPQNDTGGDCTGSPQRGFRLMLAGDAWKQSSTPGQAIAATRGCSGSGRWQDDGLSLWVLPSPTTLPSGAQAALTLASARRMRTLSVGFRGFLARPSDWSLELVASRSPTGSDPRVVAGCDTGRCTGFGLMPTGDGALVTAAGASGNPDVSNTPPRISLTLPAGTHSVSWQLRCVNPAGCSGAGIGNSSRPRDPLGQPAIFSLYHVAVRG